MFTFNSFQKNFFVMINNFFILIKLQVNVDVYATKGLVLTNLK